MRCATPLNVSRKHWFCCALSARCDARKCEVTTTLTAASQRGFERLRSAARMNGIAKTSVTHFSCRLGRRTSPNVLQ